MAIIVEQIHCFCSSDLTSSNMDDDFGEEPDFSSLLRDGEAGNKSTTQFYGSVSSAEAAPGRIQQPKPQALATRAGHSAILVSARQKGNPVLNHIRLLPWEYADIPSDYVIGNTTCALFLSLKYHRLHPEYIYSRIRSLGGKYNLRILLTMVDIPNHEDSLKELSKTSLVNNLTLILCWSAPEAAHYLELFKSSENSQPTAIRSQQAQSYKESLVEFITVPRSINKSDAASLISTFGSLQAAINAQPEQISSIPGWGEKKVQHWCDAVREEFRIPKAARRGVSQGRDMSNKRAILAYDLAEEQDPIPPSFGPEPALRAPATKSSSLQLENTALIQDDPNLSSNLAVRNSTLNRSESDEFILGEARRNGVPGNEARTINSQQLKPQQPEEGTNEAIMVALARLRDRET